MKRQFKNSERRLLRSLGALFLIFAMLTASVLTGCDEAKETRPEASADTPHLSWQSGGLFDLLPPPTTEYGSILSKSETQLKLRLTHVIKSDFTVYVQLCGEYGFTHSMASADFLYSAKRTSGERVTCQYNQGENTMTVTLDASKRIITPSVTEEELLGMQYTEAMEIIKNLGFSNVKLYAEAPSDASYTEGEVVSVTVNTLPLDGTSSFAANDTVFIRYVKTQVTADISSADLIGKRADEAESLLRANGFTNITMIELPIRASDTVTPEMNLQVVTAAIGGDPNFQRGQTFAPGIPVSVVYYTVIN